MNVVFIDINCGTHPYIHITNKKLKNHIKACHTQYFNQRNHFNANSLPKHFFFAF